MIEVSKKSCGSGGAFHNTVREGSDKPLKIKQFIERLAGRFVAHDSSLERSQKANYEHVAWFLKFFGESIDNLKKHPKMKVFQSWLERKWNMKAVWDVKLLVTMRRVDWCALWNQSIMWWTQVTGRKPEMTAFSANSSCIVRRGPNDVSYYSSRKDASIGVRIEPIHSPDNRMRRNSASMQLFRPPVCFLAVTFYQMLRFW
jgi:hypothetical protein